MFAQVNLRLLHASNIATPIAQLTRHRDRSLASQAAALAGQWREMAMDVHRRANSVLDKQAIAPHLSPMQTLG